MAATQKQQQIKQNFFSRPTPDGSRQVVYQAANKAKQPRSRRPKHVGIYTIFGMPRECERHETLLIAVFWYLRIFAHDGAKPVCFFPSSLAFGRSIHTVPILRIMQSHSPTIVLISLFTLLLLCLFVCFWFGLFLLGLLFGLLLFLFAGLSAVHWSSFSTASCGPSSQRRL